MSVNYDPGLNLLRRLFHKPDSATFARVRDRVWAVLKSAAGIKVIEDFS